MEKHTGKIAEAMAKTPAFKQAYDNLVKDLTASDPEIDLRAYRAKWLDRMRAAEKERQTFHKTGDTIIKTYRDEVATGNTSNVRKSRYNLFWSNVETMRPAIYGRAPVPAVARRHYDADPVTRLACTVLERTLGIQVDDIVSGFDDVMKMTVKDYCIPGLGQVFVEYKPVKAHVTPTNPEEEAEEHDADTEPALTPEVLYERIGFKYVPWDDYLEDVVRFDAEKRWVAKREYFTHEEMEDLVGEAVAATLVYGDKNAKPRMALGESKPKDTICIYDIWDKVSRKQILVAESFTHGPLRVLDDPLKLQGFFPCPTPLRANSTNDTLVPRADFVMYEHQLGEINEITARIRILTKALKLVGLYNGGVKGLNLEQVFKQDDNKLVKVDSWAAFAEKGGMRGNFEYLPIEEVMRVVDSLYARRELLKKDCGELIGISDIQRAQTNPNETLGAQQLKAQFGSRRLSEKQNDVARFARDLVRLGAEVVCELFSDETIWAACGGQFLPEAYEEIAPQPTVGVIEPIRRPSALFKKALGLLRNDKLRTFSVDIETDSTIAPDENAEKQRATEFTTAMGSFLPAATNVIKQEPRMAPVVMEMLLFVVRRFRVGRTMEAQFEQVVEAISKSASQPQPPAPNPDMLKTQAEIEKGKALLDIERQKAGLEMQIKTAEARTDMAVTTAEAAAENKKTMIEIAAAQNRLLGEVPPPPVLVGG